MKKLKLRKNKLRNTIITYFIVFFCLITLTLILFNNYGKRINNDVIELTNQKLNTIIYRIFNELITKDILNNEKIDDLLVLNKNRDEEIISVNYNLEKTYALLNNISKVIIKGIDDLENGKIDMDFKDDYLKSKKNHLILEVPLFLNSKNIFVNSIGPRFPVVISFNESVLTNIKTKVTNYGFNNALLEIYVTVEMQKLIITPVAKDEDKFYYDILIGAIVVNGRVPFVYGDEYIESSAILDIPMPKSL